MNRSLVLLPLVLFATAHCGSSDGVGSTTRGDAGASLEDGGTAPALDGDGGSLVVGPSDDGGLGADGCAAGDGGNADSPDPEGLDTNCDGADGVVGRDVYVSMNGADTNPGTPSAPLLTLSAALTLAATTNGSVLVLNGTYPVTTFSQGGTWAVFGGYPNGFVGQPNRQTTVFTAPDTGLLVSAAMSATLAHLTVEGDMPSALTQPTAYALRSEATKLALLDVVLQAGDGLPMTPGADGAPGADGVTSSGPLLCNGVPQPAYANGAGNGEQAVEGLATGNVTAWPSLCEITCGEGIRAPMGGAGNPASDGADAKGTVSLANGLLVGDVGQGGLANGTPGYGASAGGANTNASWSTPDTKVPGVFEGGNGGSGGCPGGGGAGGATGGGSVALLVLQGSVTVQSSVLQAGLGGDGGDGGQGGVGGTGGQGAPPTIDTIGGVVPVPNIDWPNPCTPDGDPLDDNCAEYGGIGGTGGAGGHGGGGAGGSTFAVVTAGAATCSVDASTTVTLGEPGSGGVGNGGGRAPNGQRLETFHVN